MTINHYLKCHHRDTQIMMYDGSYKMVENIQKGDEIMGYDSSPKLILSTLKGYGRLYSITHKTTGKTFTVGYDHVLCLKYNDKHININLSILLRLPLDKSKNYKGYTSVINFPYRKIHHDLNTFFHSDIEPNSLPHDYKINDLKTRKEVLEKIIDRYGIINEDSIIILIHNIFFTEDIVWLIDSLGYQCKQKLINGINFIQFDKEINCEEEIDISEEGEGDYYCFTVGDNSEYIIESFIVT